MIDRKLHSAELLAFEHIYRQYGRVVAGMDEVGRGPLAGNVVTACVVMPEEPVIQWIDDSKKLSESRREKVFDEIKNKRNAPSSVEEKIDRIIEEEENYVPIIEDVSEAHTSSQSTLKRVHTPQPTYTQEPEVYDDDVKQYVPKKEICAMSTFSR